MKKVSLFLCLMGAVFLSTAFVSCGSDESDNSGGNGSQPTEQDIRQYSLGAWQQVHQKGYVETGEYTDQNYNAHQLLITNDNVKGYYYRDGTWRKEMSGEYTLRGNKLEYRLNKEHGISIMVMSVLEISATKLVIAANFSNKGELVITYKKISQIDLVSPPDDIDKGGEPADDPGTSQVTTEQIRQYLLNHTWLSTIKTKWYKNNGKWTKKTKDKTDEKIEFTDSKVTVYKYEGGQWNVDGDGSYNFTISGNKIIVGTISLIVMDISENSVTLRFDGDDDGEVYSDITYNKVS